MEFIIKVPGLLKDEGVATIASGHEGRKTVRAIAVNHAIIVTDGEVSEWLGDDVTYIVTDQEESLADEVIDLSESGIDNESNIVRTFQSAAQLALIASAPGPKAARFLEKLVGDDEFAGKVMAKSQKHKLAA